MSYSAVEVVNSTNYPISGEISYMTFFSSDIDFTLEPNSVWKSEKHIRPIVEILAFVITDNGVFLAKSFISLGTIHHSFEVVQNNDSSFRVVKMKKVKEKESIQFLQPVI